MNSGIQFVDGEIRLDFAYVTERLSVEQKRYMTECLSCDEDLFGFVVDQILDRWTSGDVMGHTVPYLIDKARRRICDALLDKVAARVVADALNQGARGEAEADRYRRWSFELYHAIRDHATRNGSCDIARDLPAIPDWVTPKNTDEVAALAWIKERVADARKPVTPA